VTKVLSLNGARLVGRRLVVYIGDRHSHGRTAAALSSVNGDRRCHRDAPIASHMQQTPRMAGRRLCGVARPTKGRACPMRPVGRWDDHRLQPSPAWGRAGEGWVRAPFGTPLPILAFAVPFLFPLTFALSRFRPFILDLFAGAVRLQELRGFVVVAQLDKQAGS
jgi:hypothetical protein